MTRVGGGEFVKLGALALHALAGVVEFGRQTQQGILQLGLLERQAVAFERNRFGCLDDFAARLVGVIGLRYAIASGPGVSPDLS